jgi:hypothetical protein
MFDRHGRVVCSECSSLMQAVRVTVTEALFRCLQCNVCSIITMPNYGQKQTTTKDTNDDTAFS